MEIIKKITENPSAIKELSAKDLKNLSKEVRDLIIDTVSLKGGHLASNLGIVELSLALHRIFDIPPDKVIWDVGHQCYPHKILTGRAPLFCGLRQTGGLSGFPSPQEHDTDIFQTGHAGTAVSSASGLKAGQDILGDKSRVISVIGDGSLTNGLTFEGLNFLGSAKQNLLVILNDNNMSISNTKGALSYYLTRIITAPALNKPREELIDILKRVPSVGEEILRIAHRFEKTTKHLLVPGVFFEKLGLSYFGPIDGHDINQLLDILDNVKDIKEPVLLHVITKKGKGYKYSEEKPADFHGVGPFHVETGEFIENGSVSVSGYAGKVVEEIGEKKSNLLVLTAAMEKGLGLESFADKFPDRFFDVGIAESHCVAFASGLAKAGMKVIVAIYSTFLQRGYDQILHDIALQKLPVVFLVDRAGFVGGDGPTHHGIFDLSYLRIVPDIKIFAPYSLENLRDTLKKACEDIIPCAIRYPKDYLPDCLPACGGEDSQLVLLGTGSMADNSIKACNLLNKAGLRATVLAVNQIKPFDKILTDTIKNARRIVTVEENSLRGGFGSAVLEHISENSMDISVLNMGIPDKFIEQADREVLIERYGLTPEHIAEKAESFFRGKAQSSEGTSR